MINKSANLNSKPNLVIPANAGIQLTDGILCVHFS